MGRILQLLKRDNTQRRLETPDPSGHLDPLRSRNCDGGVRLTCRLRV